MVDASTYEYALQDMVFELNELMMENCTADNETKVALMHVGRIIRNKFETFELSEPKLTGPLAEPVVWYLRSEK